MKKIFKSKRISNIIFGVLGLVIGGVIFGTIGIVATTNKLEAKYVMYTKDGKKMTVQDAIKGLYTDYNKVATNIETLPTGVKAIIYLDPTDLTKECNQFNSQVGGTATSGCMKWYAFKEENIGTDNESYTMILDHNTTSNVAWNSENVNTSMKEVQTEIDKLYPPDEETPSNWKVKPRLITGQEIANITGNTSWTTSSTSDKWFHLDSNTTSCAESKNCSTGASKYYWLFDYTRECTSYGCKVADSNSNNYGYWTDTPISGHSTRVWTVRYIGRFSYYAPANDKGYGVRPVITVPKSDL